jgi:hypothetical protein
MTIQLADVQHCIMDQKLSKKYTPYKDLRVALQTLSHTAYELYLLLYETDILNINDVEYFNSKNLAIVLNVKDITIRKAIAELKDKDYALIIKYKKENNPKKYVEIVLGQELVIARKQGLEIKKITDKAFYKNMAESYNINNPILDIEEKKKLIDKYNLHCKTQKG